MMRVPGARGIESRSGIQHEELLVLDVGTLVPRPILINSFSATKYFWKDPVTGWARTRQWFFSS